MEQVQFTYRMGTWQYMAPRVWRLAWGAAFLAACVVAASLLAPPYTAGFVVMGAALSLPSASRVLRVARTVQQNPWVYPTGDIGLHADATGYTITMPVRHDFTAWSAVAARRKGRWLVLHEVGQPTLVPLVQVPEGAADAMLAWAAAEEPPPAAHPPAHIHPDGAALAFETDPAAYERFGAATTPQPHLLAAGLVVAALAFTAFGLVSVPQALRPDGTWALPLGGWIGALLALALAAWVATTRRRAGAGVRKLVETHAEQFAGIRQVWLDADGFTWTSRQGWCDVAWPTVQRVQEHQGDLYLFLGGISAIVVPASAFEDRGQAVALASRIRHWRERAGGEWRPRLRVGGTDNPFAPPPE